MSAFIKCVFLLTGLLAGKSIRLGKYVFVNGRMELSATPEEMALHARSLERNWGVLPEGDPRLNQEQSDNGQRDPAPHPERDGKQTVPGDLQPNGEGSEAGGSASEGAGAVDAQAAAAGVSPAGAGSEPSVNEKLKRAVAQLDPKNDGHWTKDGKPSMSAVSQFYGATDIVRADVEAVAPGFVRPAAD